MYCIKCKKTVTNASDVRYCGFCCGDRTANEIPPDVPDEASIETVLQRKPGLEARFKQRIPGSAEPHVAETVGPIPATITEKSATGLKGKVEKIKKAVKKVVGGKKK